MDIPDAIDFTKSIKEVCTDKDILLFAVPSVFVRSTTRTAKEYINEGQIIVDVASDRDGKTRMKNMELEFGLSMGKIRKLLVTGGVYSFSSDILGMAKTPIFH